MNLKKIFLISIIILFTSKSFAANPVSSGKFKDWQVFIATTERGKICFAQSQPKTRSPKNFKREPSKLFVTFRPQENIKDEVSVTSGHVYKTSTVNAKSGRNKYAFFSKENFAWIADEERERKFIKLMKKASNIMLIANEPKGSQTVDHYSMIGFSKAYETAKKNCS
ncbi:hypothetical protein OAB59_03565 [Pelagibacteraceae bacterium]|nr:hypothetical protein [Pelagibacteraceae bacterium]